MDVIARDAAASMLSLTSQRPCGLLNGHDRVSLQEGSLSSGCGLCQPAGRGLGCERLSGPYLCLCTVCYVRQGSGMCGVCFVRQGSGMYGVCCARQGSGMHGVCFVRQGSGMYGDAAPGHVVHHSARDFLRQSDSEAVGACGCARACVRSEMLWQQRCLQPVCEPGCRAGTLAVSPPTVQS